MRILFVQKEAGKLRLPTPDTARGRAWVELEDPGMRDSDANLLKRKMVAMKIVWSNGLSS